MQSHPLARSVLDDSNSRGMIYEVRFESASACPYSAFEVAAQSFWLPGA
jgi:hypothetical protein